MPEVAYRQFEAVGETLEEKLAYAEERWSTWYMLARLYEAENAELRGALRTCVLHDRTPIYEYGEPNPRGVKPGKGQRWNTPREVARDTLKAFSDGSEPTNG